MKKFFYETIKSKEPELRSSVKIPLHHGPGEFFTFNNLSDDKEHFAIGFGNWAQQSAPLVRIHSECITGDIFGSARCDCGNQLQEAITLFEEKGGLLLYLRQEGRGIGLYRKIEAYALQLEGLDTFAANRALGFKDDLRQYKVAAEMLTALEIKSLRLLSNNPDKEAQLKDCGLQVLSRTPTGVFLKPENTNYLSAKKNLSRHTLNLVQQLSGDLL